MEDAVDKCAAADKAGDDEQMIFWGSRFHEIIVEITGNHLLISLYKSLKPQFDYDRHWYLKMNREKSGCSEFYDEDRKIIQAFRSHDGELARQLMEHHMVIRTNGIEEFQKKDKEIN